MQVSLRRLRRTVQVLIRREPAQNSQQVHESAYVLRDPATLPEAEQVTARGRRTSAGAGGRRAGYRNWRVPGLHEQPVRHAGTGLAGPLAAADHRALTFPGAVDGAWHVPAGAPFADPDRLPDGTSPASLSRYGDGTWDLSPLSRRQHEPARQINWDLFPVALRASFKRAG